MRKYLKTQCLETLDLLSEAHAEIVNLIEKNRPERAILLLEQCQEGAIRIGQIIDEAEGDGTEEVKQLEDYCEVVYQLHEELVSARIVNARKAEKVLRKLLLHVSGGIRHGFPTRKEIVFLPYKASMWDSLESVWRKMDAEPDVEAYVIPIPYFDKNPDGSFARFHYELDQFPADVPVISYQDYDIVKRHPDAIYIHNPYDEANFVTSVHPDYYSSRLKDLTEELVYIPYFILGDIDPTDTEAVEANEHFVTVPGVVNAHKVIVQSEDWRKVYIDVMAKYTGANTRSYWEQKIESQVSPKLERVVNLKESDYTLPEDWLAIAEDKDGNRKKIVLYNTSVGVLLQESDGRLDKIGRVFETFKDYSDEVALLWRPHPLIEATLISMRPQLWEKYSEMVQEYKTAGWGIYDDSAELDRAIAVSDAYYGDWSSVVWLYKETGKPIMIQNCAI